MARIGILTTHDMYALHVRADRRLRSLTAETLEKHSLTLMEWLLLTELMAGPGSGQSLSALAKALEVTLPQITALMASLQKKRLVRQRTQKKDRRGRQAVITQRGEDLLKELEPLLMETLRKVYKNAQPGELAEYQKTLRLIAE